MKTPIQEAVDGLLDLVYPPKCLTCESLDPRHLCEACLMQIERVPRPYCPICGHQIRRRCNHCWGREPSFTAARASGDYKGVLREAIHAFKYGGARMLADPLAQVLYRYLTVYADIPWRRSECIVPVPIYPARKRVRGYNQSELLAERLSVMTGLPLAADAVVRKRNTRPQVELSGEERRANVKDAFEARKPAGIRGKIVLLVDDVATTCSTIHECSLALLHGGARNVYVTCLAFGA